MIPTILVGGRFVGVAKPSRRAYNPPVELRILGPLELVADGRLIPLGGLKQRALLAYLALHPNDVVSAASLEEAVWGAPIDLNALRTCVSRVRKLLPEGASLDHVPGGYTLRIPPDTVDSARFERAAARGRDAIVAGDTKAARAAFAEALALWRGQPLADLDDAPFAAEAARKLTELHASVVADRIDADAALGRTGLAAELETLIADRPYDERLWTALILSLYRSGRQVEALDACRRARRVFGELGLDPTPSLRALETDVLRHDPALARPPAVGTSRSRPRTSAVVAAAAVVVCAFVVSVPAAIHRGHAASIRVMPDALVELDPTSGKPLAVVNIPGGPDRVVASGPLLWVTRRSGGTIVAVDPRRRALVSLADTGLESVDALAAASGGAWAIGSSHFVRVDARLGVEARSTAPRGPDAAIGAFGSVGRAVAARHRIWLATAHGIAVLDAGTGRVVRRIVPQLKATAIAAAAQRIWAVSAPQARVVELNARTGQTLLDLRLAGRHGAFAPFLYAIAAAGKVAWVVNGNAPTLSKIDADLGEVTSTTSLGIGSNPDGITADANAVWVANSSAGTVIRVDARTGVARTFQTGFSPRGIAHAFGAIWVALQAR